MIRSMFHRLFRAARREDGTATVEFVIAVPAVLMIFMASVEAGFYMAKHVMLERGLDMVIRDVRLGRIDDLDQEVLRQRVCEATPILVGCESILMIEMRSIPVDTWTMPPAQATCIDRGEVTPPLVEFNAGGSNEMMFVRACAIQDPIFPTTGIGLRLRADANGGYQLATASVYVNEPR